MSQTVPDLDRLLNSMAEDVPPMPADFHDQWMKTVQEEMHLTKARHPAAVSQWLRILSVAAVFVFLIGGTLIYRSSRKSIFPESNSMRPAAVVTDTAGEDSGAALPAKEAYGTGVANETMTAHEAEEAYEAEAAYEAEEAYEAESTYGAEAVYEAGENAGTDTAGLAAKMDTATEVPFRKGAGKSAGLAAETDTAAEALAVNMAAEEPAEAVAEITAEESVSDETNGAVTAQRHGMGGFLADMGDFLLLVWPYVLIAVIPLAVAAAVRRFRKK